MNGDPRQPGVRAAQGFEGPAAALLAQYALDDDAEPMVAVVKLRAAWPPFLVQRFNGWWAASGGRGDYVPLKVTRTFLNEHADYLIG